MWKEKFKTVRNSPEAVLVVPHLVIHQALTSCIPGPATQQCLEFIMSGAGHCFSVKCAAEAVVMAIAINNAQVIGLQTFPKTVFPFCKL